MIFKKGYYVYVGSALNSLRGRIGRHFKRNKRTHWHIDYVTGNSMLELLEAWENLTVRRIECAKPRRIQERALESVKRFGLGDCDCYSHLHRFKSLKEVRRTLSMIGFKLVNKSKGRAASESCRLQV